MYKLFFLPVLLVAISSCKTQKNQSAAVAPVNDTISDFSCHKIIRDKELYKIITERVPVDTAYLSKDTLHVITPAIQACDAANFKLFWNGKLEKPPLSTVVKLFQRVDAGCNESHSFHLTFNTKNLRLPQSSEQLPIDTTAHTLLLQIGNKKVQIQ